MRLALLASMAAAFGCLGGAADAAVAQRSCHVESFETPVRCVTIDAPRDYDQPDAGMIKVTAVIIPANTMLRGDDDVLFFLDQNGAPLPGSADFSYTLNRRGAAPAG